jgi:DNA-binding transcriptional MerR regulator
MSLIKITDITNRLDISSRSLRYYEQIGLIKSVRPDFEKYRYFDNENVERLKQIIVLRKMQISIKDIIRIYESEDMSVVVDTFIGRINAIDEEVNALSEMKRITNEFLQTMIKNGIKKISALPLLYEEMEKELIEVEEHKPVSFSELTAVSEKLAKPVDVVIVSLPAMRVISSILKENLLESDTYGFWKWIQSQKLPTGEPGRHERFEYQTTTGDVIIQRVSDDFCNDSPYDDFAFTGGLFAAINLYLDEDLGESFRSLIKNFDDNKFYEIDYTHVGELRHPAMLENLISPDDKRELVAMLVPVKKRLADPTLFEKPEEVPYINVAEIEAANPVLWTVDVPLDKLTPINNPHYCMTENGEVEFTGYVMTRILDTNVAVKLPFRVDIEYRVDFDSGNYGYGSSEGALLIHHDKDLTYFYGINTRNNADPRLSQQAIEFYQPIFHDHYNFPKRGVIKRDNYNKITLIVGDNHLAFFVNDEMRYCGNNFPYMKLDLSREESLPITIGSGGDALKYLRKIKVSQLVNSKKTKVRKEDIQMITKKSNNIIPIIHKLVTSEHGENYWFNACAKYVMECLGESDYDYWFFAGLTGDNFAQHYKFNNPFEAVNSYHQMYGDSDYFENVFAKCGYAATFVFTRDLCKNREMYLQTLIAYIDKGIPVIALVHSASPHLVGVFVGYEEHGKTLLYISGDNSEPQRVSFDNAMGSDDFNTNGWIFVGEKKENVSLAKIYRDTILALPKLLTTNDDKYCFGAAAFRKWADDIENGIFDTMKPDEFKSWDMYINFVCVYATNACSCHSFLERAAKLNQDMTFLSEVSKLYWETDKLNHDMESLGGGFNVTLDALQDKEKRAEIVAKIREFSDCIDKVINIINENIKEY